MLWSVLENSLTGTGVSMCEGQKGCVFMGLTDSQQLLLVNSLLSMAEDCCDASITSYGTLLIH